MSCKEKYMPYQHWTREELKERLITLCFKINKRVWVLDLVLDAVTDQRWNPPTDYDGCTIIQDELHPSPACFIHDWMWKTGQGGREADLIFYQMMLLEGICKAKAIRRWLMVRTGWIFYYKWKYIKRRKINQLSTSVEKALKVLRYKNK